MALLFCNPSCRTFWILEKSRSTDKSSAVCERWYSEIKYSGSSTNPSSYFRLSSEHILLETLCKVYTKSCFNQSVWRRMKCFSLSYATELRIKKVKWLWWIDMNGSDCVKSALIRSYIDSWLLTPDKSESYCGRICATNVVLWWKLMLTPAPCYSNAVLAPC